MIIRQKQMRAFTSADAPLFETRAAEHLKQDFPKHSAFLGEEGLTQIVKHGREQAGSYGLTATGHVTFFIDLMLLLGWRFDADPQLPWAADVLSDMSLRADVKAQTLHQRATDYLDLVLGPDNEYIDLAQTRLLGEPLEMLGGAKEFLTEMKHRLKRVFPEKCLYLGDAGLEQLIRNAAASATRYDVRILVGVMLFAAMMLMLGSSFDSDPLFGWATKVLEDKQIKSPEERIQRLHAAGIEYLKQWCA